ncbi:MAG TPA: transcriptional regulator [Bryobacteraceae bacterium]|nr:transcriptional regulator [Bryobacteraceae bacterium]
MARRAAAEAPIAEKPATKAAYAPLPDVDQLIHERIRLGIVSALAANESLTFKELKTLLQTTDGNLSIHARKLEAADYILCRKSFDGRVPKTEYQLTSTGRKMFKKYLNHMEALIEAMRKR